MYKVTSYLINKALEQDANLSKDLYDVLKITPEAADLRLEEKLNVLLTESSTNYIESQQNFADFRFNHILIKNFRRYGVFDNVNYFGLRMSENVLDEKTNNINEKTLEGLVLLGDNGIGKSSIFSAIEYWATHSISEAKFRDIDDLHWFYQHSTQEADIQIITSNGNCYELENSIFQSCYDVKRFFISENGIMESASYMKKNGENGNNWFRFFCYMISIHPDLIELVFDNEEETIYRQIMKTLELLKIRIAECPNADKNLEIIHSQITDSSIILNYSERTGLRRLQEKLNNRLITWDTTFDIANFDQELDSVEISSYSHIPAIHSYILRYNDIKARLNKNPSSFGGGFSKNDFLKNQAEFINEKYELKEDLYNAVNDCLTRLNTMLSNHKSYEEIIQQENWWQKIKNIQGKFDVYQIETLIVRFSEFRKNLEIIIKNFVEEFIDADFANAVCNIFDKTFINEKNERFNFSLKNIRNNEIHLDVNNIPVHKYFNTFRYRLLCLILQVIVNMKMMKKYNFSFPILFDDVFYANDYKNKQQLYKFFDVLHEQASVIFQSDNRLQIIFFTHDEQLISTLQKKHKWFSYGRMLDVEECNELTSQIVEIDNERKYYNLYFPIYKSYRLF